MCIDTDESEKTKLENEDPIILTWGLFFAIMCMFTDNLIKADGNLSTNRTLTNCSEKIVGPKVVIKFNY